MRVWVWVCGASGLSLPAYGEVGLQGGWESMKGQRPLHITGDGRDSSEMALDLGSSHPRTYSGV